MYVKQKVKKQAKEREIEEGGRHFLFSYFALARSLGLSAVPLSITTL